jgi:hypothetical protein
VVFYVLPRRGFVSVGFWGQPPMIIPAAVAIAFAACSYIVIRSRAQAPTVDA